MNGFLPVQLDDEPDPPLVQWVRTDGRAFTESFFDETVWRLRAISPDNRLDRRRRTSLDALLDVPPGASVAGIVFHVSRCGSTLFSRTLAALPRHIVASEPRIIDAILRIRSRVPTATEDQQIAWLRGAARSLGQANRTGGERLFLKVDCWSIFSLPLLRRAFPAARLFFVHRDPLEVLVSLMRMTSYTLVRDVVTVQQLGLTREERDALAPEDYAAAVLGAFFREALRHRAALIPVAYPALPAWVWTSMPDGRFEAADREQMSRIASFHTKNTGARFAPDATEKRRSATPAQRAAIEHWAAGPYREWLDHVSPDIGLG